MTPIAIEFPGIGVYEREWLEAHPEQAQDLLRQAKGHYPVCQCRSPGSPLYIAQRSKFYLARLPNTGPQHAPQCPSYEPEPSLCGRGIYSPKALEERGDGRLQIKLSTPLSIRGTSGVPRTSLTVPAAGERLYRDTMGLRGLLHLIWERAELNRRRQGQTDKPRYAQVYRAILDAAEALSVRHVSLTRYLFVPEPFDKAVSLEIEARRQKALRERSGTAGGVPMRVLVLGQLRNIVQLKPEVCGVALSHLPREFLIRVPKPVLSRLYHESEFAWVDFPTLSYDFKLIVLFAMQRSRLGHWSAEELTGLITTQEYLPVLSMEEALLTQRLVARGRGFHKPLPYEAPASRLPNLLLTDCGASCVPIEIIADREDEAAARQSRISQYDGTTAFWLWDCAQHALPPDLMAPAQ